MARKAASRIKGAGPRNSACECCGKEVVVSEERLLNLARAGQETFCGQCRRYIRSAAARDPEAEAPPELTSLLLCRKQRKNAKRRKALASMPLGRCGTIGYDAGGAEED